MSDDPHRFFLYSDDNFFTGVVCGVYLVAYVTSVYILLSKPGFTSSRPRMYMFGITTFIFALAIIALALEKTIQARQRKLILDPSLSDSSQLACIYAWAAITSVTYILCDIICVWRAIVIWNKDKRVIAVLGTFIIGTIVAAGCAVAYGTKRGVFSINYSNTSVGKLSFIVAGPTLGSNMLGTSFIAWKAWQRRKQVREHLSEGSRRSLPVRVDRLFALLIESGLIHCFLWVLYSIGKSGHMPNPGFTVMAYVSGLYPTLIIIFVSNQMSPIEYFSTHSADMRFMRRAPALGPPSVTVTQHMLTIGRDSTADSDTQVEIPSTVFMKPFDKKETLV